MSYIKSRKHAPAPQPRLIASALAALAASVSLPMAAHAQATGAQKEVELPAVNVRAQGEVPYKADTSASPKITQPLIDTPKTIQIIKKEILQEQGATTLVEALRNTPGITMQLGENGNTSAGDAFQMRGFSTQNSTFVDGIRDLGPVVRDVFNVDQVEVVKGPAGADIGRGAASGYINLISKLPYVGNLSEANLTLGSADKKRATVDLNRSMSETSALRLNAMIQNSGVDGRNFVKNEGFAVAPSIGFGLGTPTRVHLYSQHLRQDNVPDGGIPTIGMHGFYNANAAIMAGGKVNRENFYGSAHDYEKISADMVTAKFEHDLGGGTTVRNITRYGKSNMDRLLTSIINIAAPVPGDPSTWTVSRSLQRVDQTNDILANQTSFSTSFQTGGVKHDFAGGLELMYESQLSLGTGTAAQTIRGVTYAAVPNVAANLYSPNAYDNLGVPYLTGVNTKGSTTTAAAYLFDTLTLNEAWKLNGGLRVEHYRTTTDSGTIVTAANVATFPGYAVGGVAPSSLKDSDNLLSWNVGAVYKPAPNGSIYAGYANSLTPPGSANFTLSGAAGNQANATLEPQETTGLEFGTKWELLQKRLNIAGALFQTENDKQVTTDPVTLTAVQSGKTK
ncbi:MAG: TonB-dependent receptor, partial [Burkholderiales bacterium]|nr:TonB-dependent receptor [Burkholderiales bacterium]